MYTEKNIFFLFIMEVSAHEVHSSGLAQTIIGICIFSLAVSIFCVCLEQADVVLRMLDGKWAD